MGFFSRLLGIFSGTRSSANFAGSETYSVNVVGESNYQSALNRICGGRTVEGHEKIVEATLIREDDNPYDKNAIRVDIQGHTVGYLSQEEAKRYREKVAETGHVGSPMTCSARITGGWNRGHGDKGDFGVQVDIPIPKQESIGGKKLTGGLEFRFSVDRPNEEGISGARVGEPVNFWTPPDSTKKIFIYRSYSMGGEGKLGFVPNAYVGRIASHRTQGLPIEAQIVDFTDTSCTIEGRLVPKEEVEKLKQQQQEKLREELKKPYKPKKPIIFSIDAKSYKLNIEERFKLSRSPSIDECVKDMYGVILVFSSTDGSKIIEKGDETDIKKKIVRLNHTFSELDFEVVSKPNAQSGRPSEYKLKIILPTNDA